MRPINALAALSLLPISPIVLSIPVTVQSSHRRENIWITKFNTLNATNWNGAANTSESRANQRVGKQGSHENGTAASASQVKASKTTDINELDGIASQNLATNGTYLSTTNTTLRPPNLDTQASANSTNTTVSGISVADTSVSVTAAGNLQIALVNKMPSNNVIVYISGLDTSGSLTMLGQDGAWVYPTTTSSTPQPVPANVAIPLGAPNSTTTLRLPDYLESARIWVAVGGLKFYVVATPSGPGLVEPAAVNPNDPNSVVNYSFAEFSYAAKYGIYADITAVDFVGLPLGIQLQDTNNTVYSVLGTPADAAPRLCNQLKAQAKTDGRPWDQLCAYNPSNQLIRVLAPSNIISQKPQAFGTYYAKYVNDVWTHYKTHDLTINTQASPGNVTCRVKENLLQCTGDNRGYAKPNNVDIFGCNTGPFAIQAGDNAVHYAVVPRLCAAFNRATLLLPGGNVQPGLAPAQYYRDGGRPVDSRPRNWYSQLVHEMEMEGRGYAFSYDDVAPSNGDDQSGLVGSLSPKVLRVIVGGT